MDEIEGIDYELAKLLKDAGFPQLRKETWDEERGEFYFVPTLPELIEACGYPIYLNANHEDYWYAKNATHSEAVVVEAKTKEEAVARLWLKLND